MGRALSKEVMWQAKQMSEERDEEGRPRWSQMEIAAKLGISETSVFRAIHNAGRFARMDATPLPAVRSSAQLSEEAKDSFRKVMGMQGLREDGTKMSAAEKMSFAVGVEREKGSRSDKYLNELLKGAQDGIEDGK